MTMVEKVTQAIEAARMECENARTAWFDQSEVLARDAIAAMQEPTAAMIKAGEAADLDKNPGPEESDQQWWHTEIWQAMIDAALEEK